jgi:hypothetical protein
LCSFSVIAYKPSSSPLAYEDCVVVQRGDVVGVL